MDNNILQQLMVILDGDEIFTNEPMKHHTTFRVGGTADFLVRPGMEKLSAVLQVCQRNNVPISVIGNGSNLLVGDGGIRGVVVEIGSQMSGIVCEGNTIRAEAGALLSKTAAAALENSLTGMEFAAGIPGSVGGAVVMNAGAYGGEMKDIVQSVKVLTKSGNIRLLAGAELDFDYRHSCIQSREYLVLEVVLRLREGSRDEIWECMQELKERRTSRQPLEFGSAGSTFKRPEGHFAGKLIMDAGLSGYTIGGAQVSEKHCGFIINRGDATARDVRTLIEYVQAEVKDKYQVALETEVKMVGQFY